MVRYKYANGTDAVPTELPANLITQTPTTTEPVLFVVEIHTGKLGPASYHKRLMRGIVTLMQVQEQYKKVHGAADTADIGVLLNFMKELLKDDEYEATATVPCLTEANS